MYFAMDPIDKEGTNGYGMVYTMILIKDGAYLSFHIGLITRVFVEQGVAFNSQKDPYFPYGYYSSALWQAP
jgi:hypothetical protein